MEEKYRKLTDSEIGMLEGNGCLCPDWGQVEVAANGFDARHVRQSRFTGSVKLGANSSGQAGIYNASIADCCIGHDTLISNVRGSIKNYRIGNGVFIEDCGTIVCDKAARFGNGVVVKPINEGGGREVTLFNGLTAQFAYIMAMHRENPALTERLAEIAASECAKVSKEHGIIEDGARLSGCGKILNVNIGSVAVIDGASVLSNGSVNSTAESPAYIGADVKAYDFICAEGSRIDNGAVIERCFVGENCRVDHYFSATDCLFFANSDVANGEACSVFAGPFTVSHHRSSLLIAGYFSFFNAGSGSNQSNHLFKTGAVHQGIHERGCKFGSNAYVMLPAREGAFTVVMGRHASHHDTKDLPYSYLVEEDGKTYAIPGANLRSFGTARDMGKWPARDKRTIKRDIVNFAEYNPYIGEKLSAGIGLCEKLLEKSGRDVHLVNRIRIKTPLLKRGYDLYNTAFDALLGALLSTDAEPAKTAHRHWADLSGMFAPAKEISDLLNDIEKGAVNDAETINSRLKRIHDSYDSYAKAWAVAVLGDKLGHEATSEDIATAVEKGKAATETIAAMRRDDSLRDNDGVMQTGYGIDAADAETKASDFGEVRKTQRH